MTSQGCLLCCVFAHTRPQSSKASASLSISSWQCQCQRLPQGPKDSSSTSPGRCTESFFRQWWGCSNRHWTAAVCPGGSPPKVPAPKLQSPALLTEAPHAWSPSRGRPLGLAVRGGRWEATQRELLHLGPPYISLIPVAHWVGWFDLTSCLFLLPFPFPITHCQPPHGLPDRRGRRLHATASRRPRAFLQPGCLPCI